MDSAATLTAWEPPHRFAAEGQDLGPNAPPIATEWVVEAQSGGNCIVRVVHSLFAANDDWDNQLESVESGWPALFRILRLYLTRFRGQACATFQVMGFAPEPESEAWESFTASLGLSGTGIGRRSGVVSAGAPSLTGVVEAARDGQHPYKLLVLEEPGPGAALVMVCAMGGQVATSMNFYLYGDGAAAGVASAEPLWRAWMNERFPSVAASHVA
jgi:hypothetical protein